MARDNGKFGYSANSGESSTIGTYKYRYYLLDMKSYMGKHENIKSKDCLHWKNIFGDRLVLILANVSNYKQNMPTNGGFIKQNPLGHHNVCLLPDKVFGALSVQW